MSKKIAVTIGDPNSIGAEIAVKAINSYSGDSSNIILFANKDILDFYGLKLDKPIEVVNIDFDIKNIDVGQNSIYGGEFAYNTLKYILLNIDKYNLKSLVTAPVSKFALSMAGYNYSGQTEILQKFLGKDEQMAQMLFVADDFRVMLLTRHVPLKNVTNYLNEKFIIDSVNVLNHELKKYYKIEKPKIAFCALNPHAGENTILGDEESKIIIPAVDKIKLSGIDISSPLPADALFKNAGKFYLSKQKQLYDCYIACYHDQGLCAIKPLTQEKCVNVTIGLDILRTSPSHGTAFDIAGKNIADYKPMLYAIKAADI